MFLWGQKRPQDLLLRLIPLSQFQMGCNPVIPISLHKEAKQSKILKIQVYPSKMQAQINILQSQFCLV